LKCCTVKTASTVFHPDCSRSSSRRGRSSSRGAPPARPPPCSACLAAGCSRASGGSARAAPTAHSSRRQRMQQQMRQAAAGPCPPMCSAAWARSQGGSARPGSRPRTQGTGRPRIAASCPGCPPASPGACSRRCPTPCPASPRPLACTRPAAHRPPKSPRWPTAPGSSARPHPWVPGGEGSTPCGPACVQGLRAKGARTHAHKRTGAHACMHACAHSLLAGSPYTYAHPARTRPRGVTQRCPHTRPLPPRAPLRAWASTSTRAAFMRRSGSQVRVRAVLGLQGRRGSCVHPQIVYAEGRLHAHSLAAMLLAPPRWCKLSSKHRPPSRQAARCCWSAWRSSRRGTVAHWA